MEAENKSQSVGFCGTATFLAGFRLFINVFINIIMVTAAFCREVEGKSGLNVRKKFVGIAFKREHYCSYIYNM